MKEESIVPIQPAVVKKPSLFSPEKSPTDDKLLMKSSPDSLNKSFNSMSPFLSPMKVRSRHYSSGSEPELRPVMKKIDQVEGFENLLRDSSIGKVDNFGAMDVLFL